MACQVHHLYCVFTYIYSLMIKKDLCEYQNVSVKFPCAHLKDVKKKGRVQHQPDSKSVDSTKA